MYRLQPWIACVQHGARSLYLARHNPPRPYHTQSEYINKALIRVIHLITFIFTFIIIYGEIVKAMILFRV